jgi:hypothetical protein
MKVIIYFNFLNIILFNMFNYLISDIFVAAFKNYNEESIIWGH